MKKTILFLGLLLALFACNNTPKPEQENAQQEPTAPVTITEAIQLLTDSIAMDSTDAHLYLNRAKAYFANEQVGQAMVDINKSLQLDPNNVDTYLLLADAGMLNLLNIGTTYHLKIGGRSASGANTLKGYAILTACKVTATRGNLVQGSFSFQGSGALEPFSTT